MWSSRSGNALAPLVARGWELRSGLDQGFVLARGRAPQRLSVEVVAEPAALAGAGNADAVAEDAAELGRRLRRWYAAVGIAARRQRRSLRRGAQ